MFDLLFIHPIVNLLVAIYQLLYAVHVPYALGFSIIALTLVIRLLLVPLTNSYLRSSKKMQELAPHLSRVRERHKGDSQRIQSETMQLYKDHGVNPFAGCLPMLLQIPIAWSLYSVLQKIAGLDATHTLAYVNDIVYKPSLRLTQMWDMDFFGISLAKSPHALLETALVVAVLVPAVTALLQFLQSKMMVPAVTDEKKKKDSQDDFAQAFQTQSLYLFPLMIGFASFNFPIALALYWNTFTFFGILQQYILQGQGGLTTLRNDIQQLWKKKQ